MSRLEQERVRVSLKIEGRRGREVREERKGVTEERRKRGRKVNEESLSNSEVKREITRRMDERNIKERGYEGRKT